MEIWELGGDLKVSRVGFGAMRLSGWPMGGGPAREEALAVLRRAVELGVNHIDTSHYYAQDGIAANELIREALSPYPDGLVLVTKVGALVEGGDIRLPAEEHTGLTADGLRRGVEANLRALGVDRLDVVNLRMGVGGPQETSLAEPLEALAKLRDEGLLRHVGVSNVTAGQVGQARSITSIACVQNHYNLGHRGDDALIDACAAAGIAYVPFFPVGGFQPVTAEHLETVAARHAATTAQIALAWLLARSPNVLIIPGTSSVAHLEENVAAGGITLSADDLRLLG